MTKIRAFVLMFLAISALASCSNPSDSSNTEAITNRPQNYDRFMAVIKLQAPALLTSAVRENGVTKIDPALRDEILAEQDAFVAKLANISPEIKVLFKYRFVLNAVAIVAPKSLESQFKDLSGVSYVEGDRPFARMAPVQVNAESAASEDITKKNSAIFLGARRIASELKAKDSAGNEIPVDGKGIRVGVIDTGIDYTHAMFGGEGTEEAYKRIDPNIVQPGTFPTKKVVGGRDFVGTEFDSNAPDFNRHIPLSDDNPIDEGGHGSHVSGTIAGMGDDVETYSGMAPEASLYGLKVFGKEGSTSDSIVIAALEYAANPSGDLDPKDQLDVVNLSLGSGFGTPHLLYSEAMRNLIIGGTSVVASAGNSGAFGFIVGAPSTTEETLSVAASIDDMDHNWKFGAVVFSTPTAPEILTEAVEASFAKPITEAGDIQGKLVYIGLADKDLTAEQRTALNGNVALIDRGVVTFFDKAKRAADGGAIGIVVANNQPGDPMVMGGDGSVSIPDIMITQSLGQRLKADMAQGEVRIKFKTDKRIEKPELVDSITNFSSQGPRSVDALIKPEVAAPGSNVISAAMGKGRKGVKFSGTSMASPHVTGIMALMRQYHPELTPLEMKALLINTAKIIKDTSGQLYPISRTGMGRIQAYEALTSPILVTKPTMSLGEISIETQKTVLQNFDVRNLTDKAISLSLSVAADEGLQFSMPATLELGPKEVKKVAVEVKIAPPSIQGAAKELDARIAFKTADKGEIAHLPVLAMVKKISRIKVAGLNIAAASDDDAAGAKVELSLKNEGTVEGVALPFNYLGGDDRAVAERENPSRINDCDMQSAGWRIVSKDIEGKKTDMLEVAVKLYHPLTSWQVCDVSVLFDSNGDGVADQELVGTNMATMTANQAQVAMFGSLLTDAAKMRSIRKTYEEAFPKGVENYTEAIIDMQDYLSFEHATVAVLQADLSKIAKTAAGDLRIKVATLNTNVNVPEGDDYLGKEDARWDTITPTVDGQAFVSLPETIAVKANETVKISATKGNAKGRLVVYMPNNMTTFSEIATDKQQALPQAKFTK